MLKWINKWMKEETYKQTIVLQPQKYYHKWEQREVGKGHDA
jgi:hypothetical protein